MLPFAERLAAQEVRRYVYLRTGKLLPITDKLGAEPGDRGGLEGAGGGEGGFPRAG